MDVYVHSNYLINYVASTHFKSNFATKTRIKCIQRVETFSLNNFNHLAVVFLNICRLLHNNSHRNATEFIMWKLWIICQRRVLNGTDGTHVHLILVNCGHNFEGCRFSAIKNPTNTQWSKSYWIVFWTRRITLKLHIPLRQIHPHKKYVHAWKWKKNDCDCIIIIVVQKYTSKRK